LEKQLIHHDLSKSIVKKANLSDFAKQMTLGDDSGLGNDETTNITQLSNK
jgi:hypothetical protein